MLVVFSLEFDLFYEFPGAAEVKAATRAALGMNCCCDMMFSDCMMAPLYRRTAQV